MSQQGAALQLYNLELVKCVEDLKAKRAELQQIIQKQEAEKCTLEKNAKLIMEKLAEMNKTLIQNIKTRDNYDHAIKETESGLQKIIETSQSLLSIVRHASDRLEDSDSSENCTYSHIEYNVKNDSLS